MGKRSQALKSSKVSIPLQFKFIDDFLLHIKYFVIFLPLMIHYSFFVQFCIFLFKISDLGNKTYFYHENEY